HYCKEVEVPIRVIIEDEGGFTPEEAAYLTLAFECALETLGWVRRTDAVAVRIAQQIIAEARSGDRDPRTLSNSALVALRLGPSGIIGADADNKRAEPTERS